MYGFRALYCNKSNPDRQSELQTLFNKITKPKIPQQPSQVRQYSVLCNIILIRIPLSNRHANAGACWASPPEISRCKTQHLLKGTLPKRSSTPASFPVVKKKKQHKCCSTLSLRPELCTAHLTKIICSYNCSAHSSPFSHFCTCICLSCCLPGFRLFQDFQSSNITGLRCRFAIFLCPGLLMTLLEFH